MNKIGTLDIIKAYLGNKELSVNNAYVGEIPLVKGSGPEPVPVPNDEILYTTTDGNKYDLDGIIRALVAQGAKYNGPAVVSNEYDAEKQMWRMKFEEDVTLLGDLNQATFTDEGPFFVTNQELGLNCNVETIILPKTITRIGAHTFAGCSGLTSVEIPVNVTSIGDYAFFYCIGLTSVTIPDSVTSIESNAFSSCSGLTSIEIPNSVKSIGDWVFAGCIRLTSVTIPNSVTRIETATFRGCSGLTSVEIPVNVTSIGDYAFSICTGLTSISYTGTIAQYNAITKGSGWHQNVPATVVHCTDGDTPI